MSVEIHIEWEGKTYLVGRLHTAERNATVSFEYSAEWLGRPAAFAIDPTSLPLRGGPHHSVAPFGAMQDCGPDRWGRMLIERAVRKHVLDRKPYQDLDYVLALAAVAGWRKTGRQLRLKARTLDAYATAFDHPLMDEARRLA